MTLDDRSNHKWLCVEPKTANYKQVLARWKEHFEEHLNEGSESEQPAPVDLRDDRVYIDLPSREEIEGALKYLKNNNAAGADSIANFNKGSGPDGIPRHTTDHFEELCIYFRKTTITSF
jgi:hypothetical protein